MDSVDVRMRYETLGRKVEWLINNALKINIEAPEYRHQFSPQKNIKIEAYSKDIFKSIKSQREIMDNDGKLDIDLLIREIRWLQKAIESAPIIKEPENDGPTTTK